MVNFTAFFLEIYNNPVFKIIVAYLNDKNKFLTTVSQTFTPDKTKLSDKCSYIKHLLYIILIFILFLNILYIILYTFIYNYYFANALLRQSFSKQIRLRDIPQFYQIRNLFYINEYISFDMSLVYFMMSAIIIISICYYLDKEPQFAKIKPNFSSSLNLFIVFSMLIIISGIIYYIINYNNLMNLSKRNNILLTFFYKNINKDYIIKQKICNYTEKKDILDSNFELNKCNDIELNFSIDTLYKYIKNIMNQVLHDDNNITVEKFKTLQDKDGVLYKDRLATAFFTFSLMYYYTSNNLYDEAKELFAKSNHSINPILDLNYESVLLNRPDLNYNNFLMKTAFNNKKDIYYYVYNEYYNISSEIQNLIVDIYNICKYRMISIYAYYNFILFIMIVIIIYYLILQYYSVILIKK